MSVTVERYNLPEDLEEFISQALDSANKAFNSGKPGMVLFQVQILEDESYFRFTGGFVEHSKASKLKIIMNGEDAYRKEMKTLEQERLRRISNSKKNINEHSETNI